MPTRPTPIASVKLARSLPRLLAIPVAAVVAGGAALAAGLLGVSGPLGLALAVAGGVMLLLGIAGALVAMSVHLDVEDAAVRVRWLGGERVYTLVPGPVTRVRLRGDEPSTLRAAPRFLPWQMGSGTLRGEEHVEVVRLAPTATAILVPTDRGRLAVAAASEESLLKALAAAAQARQRREELEREASAEPPAAPREPEPEPVPDTVAVEPAPPEAPEPAPEPAPAREPEPAMPRLLTGIERAMLEQQQAEAAAWAVTPEAAVVAGVVESPPAEPPLVAPVEAPIETVESVPEEVAGAPPAAEAPPAEAGEPEPAPRARRIAVARPRPSALLVLLPLVGAAAALGVGLFLDRLPSVGSDLGRLTALALVLAGPAATIGAIMARAWWPRLVGVVVAGGLAAAVFIGRALIGG